jgi:hypothetical protein
MHSWVKNFWYTLNGYFYDFCDANITWIMNLHRCSLGLGKVDLFLSCRTVWCLIQRMWSIFFSENALAKFDSDFFAQNTCLDNCTKSWCVFQKKEKSMPIFACSVTDMKHLPCLSIISEISSHLLLSLTEQQDTRKIRRYRRTWRSSWCKRRRRRSCMEQIWAFGTWSWTLWENNAQRLWNEIRDTIKNIGSISWHCIRGSPSKTKASVYHTLICYIVTVWRDDSNWH